MQLPVTGVLPFSLSGPSFFGCFFQLRQYFGQAFSISNSVTFPIGDPDNRTGNSGPLTWYSFGDNTSQSVDTASSGAAVAASVSRAIGLAPTPTEPASPRFTGTLTTVTAREYVSVGSFEIEPASVVGPLHRLYTERRPSVTLLSDEPLSQYVVGNFDCLENEKPFAKGCWARLNLNEWLTAWVRF